MKKLLLLFIVLLTLPLFSKSYIALGSKRNLFPSNTIERKFKIIPSDNTIKLFNKELQFGISSDEFGSKFDEFKFDSKENNEMKYKYGTNYSNAFDNYWITATFKDDKLICLELNGWKSREYVKLIDATLRQFKFDKTVTEEDEEVGTLKSDYYHKDDLKAEYFSFETSVLKICLGK